MLFPRRQRASEASLLTRIEALTTNNAALRQENTQLRCQLQTVHGRLRDLRHQPDHRQETQGRSQL